MRLDGSTLGREVLGSAINSRMFKTLSLLVVLQSALIVRAFALSGAGRSCHWHIEVGIFANGRTHGVRKPPQASGRKDDADPMLFACKCSQNEKGEDELDSFYTSSSLPLASTISRRGLLQSLPSAALLFPNIAAAAGSAQLPYGTSSNPVLIIGGNGRTGMAVAELLAKEGFHAVVSTRSGKDPFAKIKLPSDVSERLQFYPSSADVRNTESIAKALQETKAGAVVYAASASKPGGNASEVDGNGPANVAKAIVDSRSANGDISLVLISALALDRPESKSYQITNTMGGYIDKIMDEKYRGEESVRQIMSGDKKSSPGNYVIIRPGPLLSGKSKNGALDIELNQGDTVGGGLSRDELAGVVVGALQAGDVARGTTVECYRSKTATALQPEFALPSGRELRSDTFAGLFAGVKKD